MHCSLKMGAIIGGIFGTVLNIFDLFFVIWYLGRNLDPEEDLQEEIGAFVKLAILVIYLIHNICLVVGALKENLVLILIWIIVTIFSLVYSVAQLIFAILWHTMLSQENIFVALRTVFNCFIFWVVMKYFLNLNEELATRQRRRLATPSTTPHRTTHT